MEFVSADGPGGSPDTPLHPIPGSSSGEPSHTFSGVCRIACGNGYTLAQAVYLSGLFTPPVLCSGLAHCGRCRMRILDASSMPEPGEAERRCFSQEELDAGWRLGCRHQARPLMRVELPPQAAPVLLNSDLYPEPEERPPSGNIRKPHETGGPNTETAGPPTVETAPVASVEAGFGLAVDLGTTTLEWALCSLAGQQEDHAIPCPIWSGTCVNPQMGAGSDVLSRLALAREPDGAARLHRLTLQTLQSLFAEGEARLRQFSPGAKLCSLCLAANPAMTALALALDTTGLAAAPYSLPEHGGRWANLPGLPPLWIAPQLSPFVGGDIAAGYAGLVFKAKPPVYPFLLSDMGTNGEFLLALSPTRALAASVALGPALEGSGLSMGSEARPGAVAAFSLQAGGLTPLVLRESGRPGLYSQGQALRGEQLAGITGTGYLSLLRILLRAGVIDREGHFTRGPGAPLRRLLALSPEKGSGEEQLLSLPHGLTLFASDIEELLKVKAAFSLGLTRLLAAGGVASRNLDRLYLAGALGRHTDAETLEELGFLPPGMSARLSLAGNSSLHGAQLLLRSPEAREALPAWAQGVETVDLASDPAFSGAFAGHMRFVWP